MARCASTAPVGHEPRNLSELKAEIYAYVDSGRYNSDLAAVAGQARAWMEERAGRTIIANIGDQMSDLNGGYAERTFKLADPFYLIK
jgi:acid phosphatase